jgi:hypothetical protein
MHLLANIVKRKSPCADFGALHLAQPAEPALAVRGGEAGMAGTHLQLRRIRAVPLDCHEKSGIHKLRSSRSRIIPTSASSATAAALMQKVQWRAPSSRKTKSRSGLAASRPRGLSNGRWKFRGGICARHALAYRRILPHAHETVRSVATARRLSSDAHGPTCCWLPDPSNKPVQLQ